MTSRSMRAAAAAILFCAVLSTRAPHVPAQEPDGNFGVGVPEVFVPAYLAYRSAQLASPTPHVLRVRLGYVKGLSRSFTSMVGEAAFDLQSGASTISLSGLTPLQTYTVSLVDRVDGDLGLPDVVSGLVTFLALSPSALLTPVLPALPLDFTIDRVVVTEGLLGGTPLAAGTVNVFQRAFFRRASLVNDSSGVVLFEETTAPPPFFTRVPPLEFETEDGALPLLGLAARGDQLESAQSGSSKRSVKLDRLISLGADLFSNERFNGNGRTCGTCHPASNNFTIDPDFIASRPANDPLFVAEFNPALAQLERPQLMRSFGLILENLDGFSDPTRRFVMRGVPHTLGMPVSLARDPNLPNPPAEMTGWSADGAPGTGSLREFAIGAVTQHFTKQIARVEGRDFRLPKERELDAMEAFQLSLGRERDVNLAQTRFRDTNVETGRQLFINGTGDPNAGGRCTACHFNAGALNDLGQNRNFNTNVEDVAHPARTIQNFPKDGGFGRRNNGDGTFGDRSFNTATVVEAADTAPFFHNNVVATLEGVVDFYSGPEFNNPRAAAARFNFNQTQRDQVADFMRGINTLQNIDFAVRELREILANRSDPRREQDTRLQTAFDETQDGIDVLADGAIFPTARTRLVEARNLISQVQFTTDASQRRSLIGQAITKLGQARSIVVM